MKDDAAGEGARDDTPRGDPGAADAALRAAKLHMIRVERRLINRQLTQLLETVAALEKLEASLLRKEKALLRELKGQDAAREHAQAERAEE